MSITASEYQAWVESNWNRLSSRAGTLMDAAALRELFIMAVGIGGEAGEVQELLKKHVRDGREIRDDLRLELGDVLHYLTRIAAQFGMTIEEIMLANQDKIERRHAKREAARRAREFAQIAASAPCQACGSIGPCEDPEKCGETVLSSERKAGNGRSEKLSDRLWDLLNEATVRNELSATQLCMIDEARALAKRVEDAPVGEIVNGRANSFGGYNVEIKHDISWVCGHRVRLLKEGT